VPYQPLPLETDPNAVAIRLLTNVIARMAAAGQTYVPSAGALDTAIISELGQEIAATNARTVDAAQASVAGFGTTVVGLPAIVGSKATVPVTLTVTAPGVVVPAGLQVTGTNDESTDVTFELLSAVTAASTSVLVSMVALGVGVDYNAVPAGGLRVTTSTAVVVSAVATGASSGGVDAESADAYTGRLVTYMATLGVKAVRASDVVSVARNVPGVQRALAIDLYDSQVDNDPASAPAQKTVTVFPVDSSGDPVGADVKTNLAAALGAVREVNFIFRVADPTYTPVAVTFTAVAIRGFTASAVRDACVAAVSAFLSPRAWGATDRVGLTDWVATNTVRINDVVGVLYGVEGVAYVQSVTLNGGSANVTLPGRAALPKSTTASSSPSTVTGTVSTP